MDEKERDNMRIFHIGCLRQITRLDPANRTAKSKRFFRESSMPMDPATFLKIK